MPNNLSTTVDRIIGENSYALPTKLDPGEAVLSRNMLPVQDGSIRSRGGFKKLKDALPLGLPIDHLTFKKADGTTQELCMTDDGTKTRIYGWQLTTTTWDLVHAFASNNNYKGAMFQALDQVLAGNGVDTNIYWDGSAVTAFGGSDPVGWIFQIFEGRVMLAGNEANPANLAYSQPWQAASPDTITWGGTAYDKGGIVSVSRNDGQAITAMGVKDNYLIIEKERSKWILTIEEVQAVSELVPKIVPYRSNIGTIAPRTHDEAENDFVSLALDGIRTTGSIANVQGLQQTLLSRSILPSLNLINPAEREKACGKFFDNKYFSAIATGSSVNNNYSPVYDFLVKSWFPLDSILARFFFIYEDSTGKQYIAFGSQFEKQLYYLDPDQDFDGEAGSELAYDKTWKSKKFDFGYPDHLKTLNMIVLRGRMPAGTELEVSAIYESGSETRTIQITSDEFGVQQVVYGASLTSASSTDESAVMGESVKGGAILGEYLLTSGKTWYDFIAFLPFTPDKRFLELQVQFSNSSVDQPFQIDMFKIYSVLDQAENEDINTNFNALT